MYQTLLDFKWSVPYTLLIPLYPYICFNRFVYLQKVKTVFMPIVWRKKHCLTAFFPIYCYSWGSTLFFTWYIGRTACAVLFMYIKSNHRFSFLPSITYSLEDKSILNTIWRIHPGIVCNAHCSIYLGRTCYVLWQFESKKI